MSDHEWIRTVPTDGLWCELCGLPAAQDVGDPCPGEGAAREVEQRMMARLVGLRETLAKVHALADAWAAVPPYLVSDYDRGRVEQRQMCEAELREVLE